MALPSALGQEAVRLEVVVVDDGSTDGTSRNLRALASDNDNVRVVTHDRSYGVARARNSGVANARGEWIAFHDDDDLWSPRKLRLQLDAARVRDALFVYGGAAAVAEDGSWLYSLAPVDPDALFGALLSRNVLWGGSSNVVVRADLLRRLGGFDEKLFQLCDWDLWIRLASAARAAVCPEIVVGCVVHPRSMLLVSEDDVFEEFSYLARKHKALAEEHGVELDRGVFTRWVALGHRRAGRRARSATTYLRGAVADRDPMNVARALAALLGNPSDDSRSVVRWRSGAGRSVEAELEPEWIASYRSSAARTSVQAMSSASSPNES